MGKGRPRAVEKGVLGHGYGASHSPSFAALPQAPVFYPTEEEFKDPLEFIYKIRPQAEPFGICRIVPPKSWNPPFALDRDAFSFPTKSQAIHRLQARPPSCDPETFDLEYGRFLEAHLGKKQKRRVVFEGDELDLCRLFNAVKRYGGYDKVSKEKQWADVARFVRPAGKISECAKHVLSQLYLEHLYEYEEYNSQLVRGTKKCKRGRSCEDRKILGRSESPHRKRSRKNCGKARAKEVAHEALDQICEQCKSGLHGEAMLLCDRCDKGWHLYCLSPPLESVPVGNWYCLECVNSDKDSFGFVPAKRCSLETFRRMDDRTRRKWFGQTNASRVQIEKRFWEIVEGKAGEVEVMYGSDLETSVHGSGFPRANDPIPSSVDPNAWTEYVASPWNLNNFPKLPGSMLQAVHENIPGVMVPWLYVGMLFSSFCWHVEDHCFYSINYLHWGEPKCWYGVPGTEANAFEQVMRNALPDLFEVQPDLLFQLVTMLNPSVLQEYGVPVYGVLQEPGNFVITFPRSYHGGFNFGLNCAEAVNFAPADWLPHGGFGAELYRLYHKAAVLSHEELLYVVSKNGCDAKALPYLEEEMQRVLSREKRCREELWINGIVRSSLICPKKHPNYVGTEDDPTCIICQQYLYLSAVTCSCRPSAFVCLEHWKHLCECNTNKHQLLYRHTLAELGDLVRMVSAVSETTSVEETSQSGYSRWHHLIPNASSSMIKKVKGGLISYAQLAEDWLSNSCHILEIPFANSAYANALKEAEQFLWADHDMDPVRDMVNKLIEAQKWAMKVNSCLSKIDDYLPCQKKSSEKVTLSEIEELLSFYPLPCHEPSLTKLKAYAEDARMLIAEIESALSSCLSIGELEVLYTKATGFPIDLEKVGALACVISSAKDWLNKALECLSGKKPGFIEIGFLNKLKSEMRELHVHLPEMDLLSNLCGEAESWQIQCEEILKGPLKLKKLEDFLEAADNITVSIPELKLLQQYCCDARSWIFHLHDILQNVNNRTDHGNIVRELFCILKAGQSLRVEVDELPLVEAELKRSSCREKASEALSSKMPLEFLQQVLTDASLLEIENEQLFMEISKELTAAISWEKRAKSLIEHAAQISDFENILRAAEDIFVILPSLPNVKDALSAVQSWLNRSQPYLERAICGEGLGPLLKVDDLKELVSQSKLLKVTFDAPERLHSILKEVDRWEHDACTLLQHSKTLLYMHNNDFRVDNGLSGKIKDLLGTIDSTTEIGRSLGFEFKVLPKLKHASLILQWSLTALSFCSRIPFLKEVDSILEDMDHHLAIFSGSNLVEVLIRGTSWLRKALTVLPEPQISKRCKLKDVEQILEEIQEIVVPYPMIVAQLQNAIDRHESWIKQAHSFFWLPGQQSWANLLKLKECGQYDALDCPELDKVAFEIEKVEKWMFQCHAVVEPLVGDLGSLLAELEKIKGSLDRALCIYRGSRGCRDGTSCVCCPDDSENKEVYICLRCEDWYHFSCMGPPFATAGITDEYSCPFCLFIESGAISRNGGQALICRGNRPELKSFIEFLSVAGDFCTGVKELDLVQEIVNKARDCKSYLTEIVDRAISHDDKDLSSISDSLLSALKAISVAGVYDQEGGCNLESALSRNSWKIKVKKLLRGSEKPVIQQIQRLVKEGLAMSIPSEDHFMKEITEVKQISLQWVDIAKQIISDSGEHALSEVFKVIGEGKSLPVHFEKELKLLKARSTLYCICRKPYDQRAMIACDQCDEWYHFDCINLHEPPPNTFYCPACQPVNGVFVSLPHSIYQGERSSADGEPPTSPACHDESKRRHPMKVTCNSPQKHQVRVDLVNFLRSSSEIDHLWRENKRPLQRTARRRGKFGGFSCYSWSQHVNE